jgi:hypothetical protein
MDEATFRIVVTVAVALACIAFLVQAGVALALFKIARALQAKVNTVTESVAPIIDNTKQIVAENRPKVAEITQNVVAISGNAAEISRSARDQVARIGDVVRDSSHRAKVRVAQLDDSIDSGIDKAGQAGAAIKTAAMKPVVQAHGVIAAVRAALAAYSNGHRRSSVEHATQDEEMFI